MGRGKVRSAVRPRRGAGPAQGRRHRDRRWAGDTGRHECYERGPDCHRGGRLSEQGFVASLARPGGNVTGLTVVNVELSAKKVELLKAALPRVSRIAILGNPSNLSYELILKETQRAAQLLGVQLQVVEVRDGSELEGAFAAMTRGRAGAFINAPDELFFAHRRRILDLAAKSRLPGMGDNRSFVEEGGLMAYGPSFPEMFRRAASYVDRILRGAKPGDLPVEQPTKFEFIVNLKTAKALGLTIPPSVLARADEVIHP